MNRLSLLQAWASWFSGNRVDDSVLWGLRILWWGRFGKMAELLAGTAVVVEIIGPERLRAFGKSLHRESEKKPFQRFLQQPWLIIPFIPLTYVTWITMWAIVNKLMQNANGDERVLVIFVSGFLIIVALWVVATSFSALKFLSYLADSLLKGIAVALEFPAIDRIIKLAALLLLLFGFHFDLLSS